MFNYHPLIKILLVFIVCLSIAYTHYLLFNALDYKSAVNESIILKVGLVAYLGVILIFVDYYLRNGRYLIFSIWVIFNLSLCTNFLVYQNDVTPPLWLQYSQSTSLLIYATLLAFSKDRSPNWLRIFSLSCLVVLIPCLIFYFSESWFYYEITVYILCFTPIVKSFVFIRDYRRTEPNVIDGGDD